MDARQRAAAAARDALTDPLTGLPDRRHLDAALDARVEDVARYGHGFGALVVDIDHFKAVNDRHGHETGDQALRAVAGTLRGGVRVGDLVGRWGGEEFLILGTAEGSNGLRELAERWRALVASARTRLPDGSDLETRVSVGGAVARPGEAPDDLFERADRALYAAKTGGRDRVVMAGDRAGPR